MRKSLIVLALFALGIGSVSFGGWEVNFEYDSAYTCHDVYFVNEDTGYVCGEGGTIFCTENAGKIWKQQLEFADNRNFNAISFADSQHGWMVGYEQLEDDTLIGFIYCIQEGDTAWQLYDTSAGGFYDITFIDSLYGWIAGFDNNSRTALYRTVDGGINWERQDLDFLGHIEKVSFIDRHNGWCLGTLYNPIRGALFHSVDGGSTWTIKMEKPDTLLKDIEFADPQNGWLVGYTRYGKVGYLWNTIDSGENWNVSWTVEDTLRPVEFLTIDFLNSKKGWIGATSYGIAYTSDSGQTWQWQEIEDLETYGVRSFHILSATELWACGGYSSRGAVFHYSETGVEEFSKTEPVTLRSAPNPFTRHTLISFYLPRRCGVKLAIYNILGQEIKELEKGEKPKGNYAIVWNATDQSEQPVPSGLYFLKLDTGDSIQKQKLIVF